MNEGTILPLKQSVYHLKALIDHPEYESWDWKVQLSKLLDDIAWWHKCERPLTNSSSRAAGACADWMSCQRYKPPPA